MEGRWATLAVRAQREGILDYSRYRPGDSAWKLRESFLLDSLESSILADQIKALLPIASDPTEAINKLAAIETPWLDAERSRRELEKNLVEQWKALEEKAKNGG